MLLLSFRVGLTIEHLYFVSAKEDLLFNVWKTADDVYGLCTCCVFLPRLCVSRAIAELFLFKIVDRRNVTCGNCFFNFSPALEAIAKAACVEPLTYTRHLLCVVASPVFSSAQSSRSQTQECWETRSVQTSCALLVHGGALGLLSL